MLTLSTAHTGPNDSESPLVSMANAVVEGGIRKHLTMMGGMYRASSAISPVQHQPGPDQLFHQPDGDGLVDRKANSGLRSNICFQLLLVFLDHRRGDVETDVILEPEK